MTVWFDVPGDPVPKGRPRFARVGAGVRTFTPAKTQSYEQLVSLIARQAMRGRDPMTGPVQVTFSFGFPIPSSWPRKTREAAAMGEIWPTTRCDIDNACKSVCDGMNGIVYKDDSQIVRLHAVKQYAIEPGCSVKVEPIKENA